MATEGVTGSLLPETRFGVSESMSALHSEVLPMRWEPDGAGKKVAGRCRDRTVSDRDNDFPPENGGGVRACEIKRDRARRSSPGDVLAGSLLRPSAAEASD